MQPHEVVWHLTTALIASRSLHVVAELGVADHIREEAVRVKELATRCGVDPDALERVLRLLETHGVFEAQGDAFAHTEASLLLRTDHPMSMRALAQLMNLPAFVTTGGSQLPAGAVNSPLDRVAPVQRGGGLTRQRGGRTLQLQRTRYRWYSWD
ncbi:MAG: hypothetical protein M3P85_09185 [Actinomycetota bacterium]|nr:hypothetical protein [Actinomycetota bacterium]